MLICSKLSVNDVGVVVLS